MRSLPLATLRTFEAAARHQSLMKAAQELGLTDSAASHQLRKLEASLGCSLFRKAGRGVTLTDAGRIFARSVSTALQDIASTAARLADAGHVGGRITIACPPMFASKWLAKNLAYFYQDHSSVECHIHLVDNDDVIDVPDADIGIQFGAGGWKSKWTALLENVTIAPACSPRLYQMTGRTLTHPSDLRDVVLLHRDDGTEWRRWLAGVGDHAFERYRRHLYCSDLSAAIDLAVEGAGIVLVSDTLSASDMREGTLLRPFADSIDATGGWYVLCDQSRLEKSSTRLFLHWLLSRFGKIAALGAEDQAAAAVLFESP